MSCGNFSLRQSTGEPVTNDQLVALSDGASAILTSPSVPLNADFFTRIPSSVKVVATMSVGYDHIDLAAAKRKGIPVANTPGVLTDAVADATVLLCWRRRATPTKRRSSYDRESGRRRSPSLSWPASDG